MQSFAEFLAELRDGEVDLELSQELAELGRRVQETGKVGSLSLTISLKPAGNGRVFVSDSLKAVKPGLDRPSAIFFLGDNGNLSRRAPGQMSLEDFTKGDR